MTTTAPPQGNAPDELPEQLLGVGRIFRTDFRSAAPLPAKGSAAGHPGH
jgi:hypothetical protein